MRVKGFISPGASSMRRRGVDAPQASEDNGERQSKIDEGGNEAGLDAPCCFAAVVVRG